MLHIPLDIGAMDYQEIGHLKILPPIPDKDIERALSTLHLASHEKFDWHHHDAWHFLSMFVDLSHVFKTLQCYPEADELLHERKVTLRNGSRTHSPGGTRP